MKKSDITNPIENAIIQWKDLSFYAKYNTELIEHFKNNYPSLPAHKKKLGRQKYCWFNGEFRFWIWEGENWRVYVSPKKGACFEVREGLRADKAYEAWQDYRKKMK